MAAIAAVAAGCSKEELEGGSESGQEKVAMSFSSEALTTRTSLVDGQKVVWTEDDAIGIFGGSAAVEEFVLTEIDPEDASRATFRGEAVPSDTYYAIYPFNPEAAIEGNVISTELPSGQPAEAGTFGTGINLSAAVAAQDNTLTFRNLCGLVTVELSSVPEGYELEGLVLEGRNGEKLAGQVSITAGGAGLNAAPAESSSTAVTLKAADGAPLAAGTYVFTILPADFTGGLRIVFDYGESGRSEVLTGEPVKVSAGENHRLPAVSAKAPEGTAGNPYRISTADELLAFAAASGEYSSDDVVALDADIDMTGKAWTPFVLGCQFDGRGHRIYNISSDAGCIFTDISSGAVLKDVVFGSKDGTAYDGTSSISMSGTAGNTGLAGTSSGTVSGVTSFIPVKAETASPATANEVRVGGLVGSNYGSISGCVYGGSINVSGTSDKMIFIGGITGWNSERSVSITNTSNKGSIYVDNDHGQAAAGIAGMHRGGDITGCTNSGKITVKNSSAKNSYFGGIAGFIQIQAASGSRIEDCSNTGEFDMSNTTVFGAGGIAGVIHRAATGAVTLSGCENSADVFMSGSHTAENVNLGGIAGMCDANNSNPYTGTNVISSCTNSGKIYYRESRSLGNLDGNISTAGGIIGWTNNRIEITGCTNTGAVSSDKISLDYLGGIAGYVNSGTVIKDCSNTAPVTLDLGTTVTYSGGSRPGAGGIACYTGGTVSLEGNENSGAVSITISKSDQCAAGGIVATTEGNLTLTGNTNSGPVTSTSGTQDRPAGGIVGRVMRTLTMSGNTNTGAVTAVGADGFDSDNVMAGGLIGLIDQGAAHVPTVINSEKDVADCAVSSTVGRAGLLFAIMNHVASGDYQPSAVFTDCRIGGTVEGKVKDGSETSGPVTLDATNFEDYSYSYKGANAVLTITGLSLAE